MFYSDVSFIIRDIGNNGFFVSYKDGKTKQAYVSKDDIIEYMLRYDKYGMTYLDRKRKNKLIVLKIMSE